MDDKGLPIINKVRCTGCGKCETICPKKIIELIPINSKINVACNSKDRGQKAKHDCPVACIGCGLCAKVCPHGAVKMVDNLPVIDKHICIELCSDPVCMAKCPTKTIKYVS
jgi:Fe-S-cluster-containing hydrogenase component 2